MTFSIREYTYVLQIIYDVLMLPPFLREVSCFSQTPSSPLHQRNRRSQFAIEFCRVVTPEHTPCAPSFSTSYSELVSLGTALSSQARQASLGQHRSAGQFPGAADPYSKHSSWHNNKVSQHQESRVCLFELRGDNALAPLHYNHNYLA